MPQTRRARAGWATVVAVIAIGLSACAPEPAPGESTASPTSTASASPTPSPPVTDVPAALPASCEDAYSPAMLASLQADVPPLNDPGITMLPSQNVDALDVLESGIPTLRCTWGPPSERGIATSISLVSAQQSDDLAAILLTAGFSEEPLGTGTVYRIAQEMVGEGDQLVSMGETHFLGDGGWVATRWINVDPPGYTEDIVATIWD